MYLRTFSSTLEANSSIPISGVFPMWGVIRQFSNSHKTWSSGRGSGSVTSSTAPKIWPDCRASTRSAVTTCFPLATFTSTAFSDIIPKKEESTILVVAGVRASASTTTSADGRILGRSSRRAVWVALGTFSFDLLTTVVSQSKADNKGSRSFAIPPAPRITTWDPNRVSPTGALHPFVLA